MEVSEPNLKPELMLKEQSGTVIYTIDNDIVFYYPYLPEPDEIPRLYCIAPNSKEILMPCESLEIATNRAYVFYKSNSKNKHGGKRFGAGRKRSPETKPVRINVLEQQLIQNFRSTNLDKKHLLKKLIKIMAALDMQTSQS